MAHHISCPGKINLFLDVMGQLENGYHQILTLFLPVAGVEDKLTLTENHGLQIICQSPQVPLDSTNLCWQAAEKFAAAAAVNPAWRIEIDKKLPVAGGMGGGSANAGRLLYLLNQLYPGRVSDARLREIALSIGADVPFFLNPFPSLASGVGEKITYLQVKKPIPILLVAFSFPIAAAWAYANRRRPFNSSGLNEQSVKKLWEAAAIDKLLYNDLGAAVKRKFPAIKIALADLEAAGAVKAIVSGSGPTVFGVFNSLVAREKAFAQLLGAGYPGESLIAATAG